MRKMIYNLFPKMNIKNTKMKNKKKPWKFLMIMPKINKILHKNW